MVQVLSLSQHHQLVGGVAGVTFVEEGEKRWIELSVLVSGCLMLRAKRFLVGEKAPHICDQGLFVLLDTV